MALLGKLRLGIWLQLFVDALLLLAFMAQAFVAGCLLVYGYLPLPAGWGNQLITEKFPSGLVLSVDEFQLRAGGSIDLIGVKLRSTDIQKPLLEAKSARIKLRWNGFKELPGAESFVLSRGTLYIPAVYSPDGHHRPIFERIALRSIPGQTNWRVDRFAALHESIRLRGAFELPAEKEQLDETDKVFSVEQRIHQFYTQMAKLSQQKDRIRYFEEPTIAFKLASLDSQTQQMDLRISSRQFQHPEASAENVLLEGSVLIQNSEIVPLSNPRLSADRLKLDLADLLAEGLSVELPGEELSGLLTGEWPNLKLAAQRLTLRDLAFTSPILQVDPKAYPKIAFQGAVSSSNGAVNLSGQVHAESHNGQVQARGSVDLLEYAPAKLAAKMPAITHEAPPYYDLSLDFDDGFTLSRAKLSAQVDALQVDGLTFDHISARASYQNGIYAIDDLYLRRKKQWLDLTFSFDRASSDYRVALIGSAVPNEYNALLPRWWAAIFRDFDFSKTDDSLGDFVIYGNTQRKVADLYFGHAKTGRVDYKGVALDYGELIVRGRGPYTELHDLRARSGDGWARGNISFTSKIDEVNGPASVRLDLEAKLRLDDAAKLFSGNAAQIIADFKTEGLPLVTLEGVIFNNRYSQYVGKSYFNLSAACAEPLHFKDVPIEQLSFDLFGRSEITYLRNIRFGYAKGQARAEIDVLTPTEAANSLRYQFSLSDADQNMAIHSLPQLNDLENSLQAENSTENSQTADHTSRVDIRIHGTGPVEDPLRHTGFGNFEMRNENLGTIQLLGPLSKALQNTQFNFTSFSLDKMRGNFRYKNDAVHFKPLQIDGPLTQIRAPGSLGLSDQSLDMRVTVSLFGNAGNPDSNIRKLGDFISKPIPNLLQFELTGTLQNQKLRSLYDPRNLILGF